MSLVDTLRRAIARDGGPLTLRRVATGQVPVDVAVRGLVRDYRPDELVGNISQGDRRVTLGNAEIAAAGWPLPIRKGDQVLDEGRVYTVQSCNTLRLRGEVARHEIVARG
jgi:hypothetical protein